MRPTVQGPADLGTVDESVLNRQDEERTWGE